MALGPVGFMKDIAVASAQLAVFAARLRGSDFVTIRARSPQGGDVGPFLADAEPARFQPLFRMSPARLPVAPLELVLAALNPQIAPASTDGARLAIEAGDVVSGAGMMVPLSLAGRDEARGGGAQPPAPSDAERPAQSVSASIGDLAKEIARMEGELVAARRELVDAGPRVLPVHIPPLMGGLALLQALASFSPAAKSAAGVLVVLLGRAEGGTADALTELFDRHVNTLELSPRTERGFRHEQIEYVGQICQMDGARLIRINNFGRNSVREVTKVLGAMGLGLDMEEARRWVRPEDR